MYKVCPACDQWKLLDDFRPSDRYRCRECERTYMRAYSDKNRQSINSNQRRYHTTLIGRANLLVNAALKRAKIKNEEFKLTHDDVIKGLTLGFCVKTGLKFDFNETYIRATNRKMNPAAPSIDKINSFGIYEPSNVQYVSAWYNMAKGQLTEPELIQLCKAVVNVAE